MLVGRGAVGLIGGGVTGSDGGVSVGCGGTASGFSTTVVVSGGGGSGGCLAGVWARAVVAEVARTSASMPQANRRPLYSPSHMNGPRPPRQSECDCDTPAWLSAADKLGLAISADILGCAASAAHAFWLDDSAESAAELWLTAANACGLAIIAANACGLASTACDAAALSFPAAAAEATSD